MKKLKWCIIGAGGIADRRTIPAIISDKNNELVAVMDKVLPVAEKMGEKYGVPYYDDEDKMLRENECDAVYISTPVFCHYDQAMTALKYGRNVFLEKPVGMDGKEAEKLLNAFKKAGKQLSVGYLMKHHNLHEKARKMIKEGAIGGPVNTRLQFSCWYPDIEGAWRQKKSLGGGGAMMDLGVHCIELIEYILDEEIVQAKAICTTKTFSYEVEDSAVMVFKTASGVLGHIDVNFNIPDKASEAKLEIYGDKGYIICKNTLSQVEGGSMLYLYSPQGDYEAQQNRVLDKPKKYYGAKGNLYLKEISKFANIVRSGKPDYHFAERAVQVQKVVDKIYKEN